jgi:hypothetical protein
MVVAVFLFFVSGMKEEWSQPSNVGSNKGMVMATRTLYLLRRPSGKKIWFWVELSWNYTV